MPKFSYLVKRSPTETLEGTLEADSRVRAVAQLIEMGYTPIRIQEALDAKKPAAIPAPRSVAPLNIKVPHRHLNQFTRQFASLVRSQVPILRILGILQDQTEHPRLRRILRSLEEEIRQGQTLSMAMEKYPKVFSPLYVSLIRSGEVGGMLEAILERLALQADREEELHSKIQTSLAYPAFVGVVGFFTILFLMAFVIPRLVRLFDLFGADLPLPTRLLLSLAKGAGSNWFWLGGAAVVAVAGIVFMSRLEQWRTRIDALKLHLPLIGPLTRQLELTRFSRSFGLLLDHGVPILQATEVALPVVKNQVLRKELERLPNHLKDGNILSQGLQGMKISTAFLIHTVAVGEEGGRLGEAFMEVADFYEREVERLLRLLAALLEPTVILAVGGVVGFIVLAVLLPILTMGAVAR